MIYADFENILVPEDNEKQNMNQSYTNKYQKHVACSYDYNLVCVDDNLVTLSNDPQTKMLFTIVLAI